MTYWRMQLHPSSPGHSAQHAAESLAAGYIGLDFAEDLGDMMRLSAHAVPSSAKDYLAFANEMTIGDLVLVVSHHYPFALAEVTGDYNYIRHPEEELGVWFRHFRRVSCVRYCRDFVTNPDKWVQTTMTDTISVLRDPNSISFRLIEDWKRACGEQ
jgi:hypothetical protein